MDDELRDPGDGGGGGGGTLRVGEGVEGGSKGEAWFVCLVYK